MFLLLYNENRIIELYNCYKQLVKKSKFFSRVPRGIMVLGDYNYLCLRYVRIKKFAVLTALRGEMEKTWILY